MSSTHVTDSAAVEAAVEKVVRGAGGDVLVNDAGIGAVGTVADNSLEQWQRTFDVNVLGVVRVSGAALTHLRRSPAAAIGHTCSVTADGVSAASTFLASPRSGATSGTALTVDGRLTGSRTPPRG